MTISFGLLRRRTSLNEIIRTSDLYSISSRLRECLLRLNNGYTTENAFDINIWDQQKIKNAGSGDTSGGEDFF